MTEAALNRMALVIDARRRLGGKLGPEEAFVELLTLVDGYISARDTRLAAVHTRSKKLWNAPKNEVDASLVSMKDAYAAEKVALAKLRAIVRDDKERSR